MNVTECPGMAKIYKPQTNQKTTVSMFISCIAATLVGGRWNLSLTCKSQQRLDTHGHDRVDLKNFDFSYEQLRKEICTTIFTNRIILSPRGQSIKRSTNKSKPLIIHFTYLYMIINCVSLFSRKGCCCVCVCVYVSVCVCVLVWFTKGKYSLQTSYCVFKDQIIL
jgi:hypothetical protein